MAGCMKSIFVDFLILVRFWFYMAMNLNVETLIRNLLLESKTCFNHGKSDRGKFLFFRAIDFSLFTYKDNSQVNSSRNKEYEDTFTFVDSLNKGSGVDLAIHVLSDSNGLPREKEGVKLAGVFSALLQCKAMEKRVDCKVYAHSWRGLSSRQLRRNISEVLKGDFQHKRNVFIVYLGIVDSAPRVFLQNDILALTKVGGQELKNLAIEISQKYRSFLTDNLVPRVYVDRTEFTDNLSEVLNEIASHVPNSEVFFCQIISPFMNVESESKKRLIDSVGRYNDSLERICSSSESNLLRISDEVYSKPSAENFFLKDFYHLNGKGHELVCDVIWRKITDSTS